MKALKLFLMLVCLFPAFACKVDGAEPTETNKAQREEVKKFVDELLKYRNEKGIIFQIPRNPISSPHQTECTIYILWY